MTQGEDQLTLMVTASLAGVIGYGNLYQCRVVKKIAGNLNEEAISVTILAGDHEKLAFMSAHLDPHELVIGFKKKRENEPYAMMPISGFVDKDKTSWEIDALMPASRWKP